MHSSCVALNIQWGNELSATSYYTLCCYKRYPLTPRRTPALTHLTTRCGTRAKYKQALAAQSEVTFTRRPITVSHNVQFSSTSLSLPPQCYAAEVSGLLYNNISKRWLCTRVSHALAMMQTHRDRHRGRI